MMRAAIYARRSTDDLRDELARSVDRQVAHAREYATRRGWTVLDAHVYTDDGVSGGEFVNRRGLIRLLNALKPSPPFGILVMAEPSRLGRERLRTELMAREITDAGVRIFYYLTDEEQRLDTPELRFVMAARGFAAEVEREKARLRTRDALQARARRGHVTGGVVFGYRNVPVFSGRDASGNPIRSHVELAIEPNEADVVRGMFHMFAAGHGLRKIARALNADPSLAELNAQYFGGRRIAPPRKGSGSWAPSCVNAMLLNERYRGVQVWGRHRNTDRGGRTRLRAPQDSSSWLRVETPELRIIDEELWQLAQSRRRTVDRVPGPRAYPMSRSLLSGIGSCSMCSAPIVISGSKKRVQCYGCGYYRERGTTVCTNNLLEPTEAVDRAFIAAVEREVLDGGTRRAMLERAAQLLTQSVRGANERIEQIQNDLSRVQREIANLLRALEAAGPSPSIVERLRDRERDRAQLTAQLDSHRSITKASELDIRRLDRILAEHLSQFGDMLREDVAGARAALSKLLVGRVQFQPTTAEVNGKLQRSYRLEAEIAVGRLLVASDGYREVHVPRYFHFEPTPRLVRSGSSLQREPCRLTGRVQRAPASARPGILNRPRARGGAALRSSSRRRRSPPGRQLWVVSVGDRAPPDGIEHSLRRIVSGRSAERLGLLRRAR